MILQHSDRRAQHATWASLAALALSCHSAQPSPAVIAATPPASIPLQAATTPPHEPLQPGINPGAKGSTNVWWTFGTAPHDGVDAMRITLTPVRLNTPASNIIYWAFEGAFLDKQAYYVGLQPNGEFGQTALFSVFGSGATPASPICKSGADGGAGVHCHIHYPWTLGHSYEFIVRLAGGDTDNYVWEGVVSDLSTGDVTVIGDIAVTAQRGLLWANGISFSEFFKRPTPCPAQPRSEILVHQPFAYRSGHEFPGGVHSLNMNSGCSPQFYGDGKTYIYVGTGG